MKMAPDRNTEQRIQSGKHSSRHGYFGHYNFWIFLWIFYGWSKM